MSPFPGHGEHHVVVVVSEPRAPRADLLFAALPRVFASLPTGSTEGLCFPSGSESDLLSLLSGLQLAAASSAEALLLPSALHPLVLLTWSALNWITDN